MILTILLALILLVCRLAEVKAVGLTVESFFDLTPLIADSLLVILLLKRLFLPKSSVSLLVV